MIIVPNFSSDPKQDRIDRVTVSRAEVAKMTGLSEKTIYNLTKTGKLACKPVGRRILYSVLEIQRYFGETQPQTKIERGNHEQ